jgi:hypothetical protein
MDIALSVGVDMARLTFSIDTRDWVWLCEMLADIRAYDEVEPVMHEDMERAISCLESLEAAV